MQKISLSMELYTQTEDITVTGLQVKSFPDGIKEAFQTLMKNLGDGHAFYGISWMDGDTVVYYAMAEEAFPGEGDRYEYESLTIEKGVYRSETIYDWMGKTDSIKDVFLDLTVNITPDKNHPCVEWYKSDEEMVCMVRDN